MPRLGPWPLVKIPSAPGKVEGLGAWRKSSVSDLSTKVEDRSTWNSVPGAGGKEQVLGTSMMLRNV